MHEVSEPPVSGASFWVRAMAHLVDMMLLTSMICVLSLPMAFRMLSTGSTEIPGWMRRLEIPVDLMLLFGVVLLWRKTQTTPGKKLFGLRIVDFQTGGPPSWRQLFVRYFGYLVSFLPVIPFRVLEGTMPGEVKMMVPMIAELTDGWEGWVFGPPLCFGFLWILVDSRRRGWHDLISGTVTAPALDVAKAGSAGVR